MDSLDLLLDAPPVLVINKPGGILTQAPPQLDSIESRVRAFETHRTAAAGKVYVGVPHRLDRPASGVIVMARNVRATRRLSDQFAGRMVQKQYWALVEGRVEPESGSWHDWMRKIPGEARSELVPSDHADARSAVLHYRVREWQDGWTWLQIALETGRTHQIRLQCASRGFPILGDWLYGARRAFGPQTDDERARWIALHARSLAFCHPQSRESVEVVAPLAEWWRDYLPAELA